MISHVILDYNSIIRERCGVTIKYEWIYTSLIIYLVATRALNKMSVVIIDG